MKYILEIKNLSKKFGKNLVLDNINLKIKKGEIIGLIGSNGAGKTTLSEIIVGISKQTSGSIKYNFQYKKTFKEKIGMQFQDSTYPSGLTVKNLILFARDLHRINISQAKLKQLLETFQMGNFYKRKVKSLSSGQRQKINILLSIIHNPEIVILDELTTGLDISAREEIISFTKKLIKERNISAILISHHMHEIEALSNKVVVLSEGKIVKESTIKDIEKKYKSLSNYMIKLISSNQKEITDINIFETNDILTSTKRGLRWMIKLFLQNKKKVKNESNI